MSLEYQFSPSVDDSWSMEKLVLEAIPPAWQECFELSEKELLAAAESVERKEKKALNMTAPHRRDIFNAFYLVRPENVQIVIIGQDPYPGKDKLTGELQANGMCFSVTKGMEIPFSLKVIYNELERCYKGTDREFIIPDHGDLTRWADQGILLLNRALTLELGEPNSHKNCWLGFINKVINYILNINPECIFLLWGKSPEVVDMIKGRGVIFVTNHPAASRYGGADSFKECGHFLLVDDILKARGKMIDWRL